MLSLIEEEGYAFVAVFGLLVLRRAYLLTRGVPLRPSVLAVFPALYLLIYLGELAVIYLSAIGTARWLSAEVGLAADGVLLAGGTWLAHSHSRRRVELYQPAEDPRWYYRLPPLLPVAYVTLFFVRTAVAAVVVGETPFVIPSPSQLASISDLAWYTLLGVDALWGLTTGFLVGRSVAVFRAWQTRSAVSTAPSSPLS
jgi:hypothetical protein